MRVLNHFIQVFKAVSCCLAGSESGSTNIDSVRTGLYGRTGYLFVFGRG
jgi:hypothetical protein